jgi:hypothetical protein
MAEPSAYLLSRSLSQLTGRKVTFVQATAPLDVKIKQIYGIYALLPFETAIVVKADLPLLGSLAGALVGLPDATVKEHLKVAPVDELLRDAINEVLNIVAASITTEGRAVFSKMVSETVYIDGAAEQVYKKPDHKSYFNVLVEGYQGGRFSIFAPFCVGRTVAF